MRTNYNDQVIQLEERNKMLKEQVKQQDFKIKRVSTICVINCSTNLKSEILK